MRPPPPTPTAAPPPPPPTARALPHNSSDESLPRDNGELVFDRRGKPRAGHCRRGGREAGPSLGCFRQRLMASIAEDPHRPYYESWSKALESLVVDMDLATAAALDAATPTERAAL